MAKTVTLGLAESEAASSGATDLIPDPNAGAGGSLSFTAGQQYPDKGFAGVRGAVAAALAARQPNGMLQMNGGYSSGGEGGDATCKSPHCLPQLPPAPAQGPFQAHR